VKKIRQDQVYEEGQEVELEEAIFAERQTTFSQQHCATHVRASCGKNDSFISYF